MELRYIKREVVEPVELNDEGAAVVCKRFTVNVLQSFTPHIEGGQGVWLDVPIVTEV